MNIKAITCTLTGILLISATTYGDSLALLDRHQEDFFPALGLFLYEDVIITNKLEHLLAEDSVIGKGNYVKTMENLTQIFPDMRSMGVQPGTTNIVRLVADKDGFRRRDIIEVQSDDMFARLCDDELDALIHKTYMDAGSLTFVRTKHESETTVTIYNDPFAFPPFVLFGRNENPNISLSNLKVFRSDFTGDNGQGVFVFSNIPPLGMTLTVSTLPNDPSQVEHISMSVRGDVVSQTKYSNHMPTGVELFPGVKREEWYIGLSQTNLMYHYRQWSVLCSTISLRESLPDNIRQLSIPAGAEIIDMRTIPPKMRTARKHVIIPDDLDLILSWPPSI